MLGAGEGCGRSGNDPTEVFGAVVDTHWVLEADDRKAGAEIVILVDVSYEVVM